MSARPSVHGYRADEGTRRHSRLGVRGRGRWRLRAPDSLPAWIIPTNWKRGAFRRWRWTNGNGWI